MRFPRIVVPVTDEPVTAMPASMLPAMTLPAPGAPMIVPPASEPMSIPDPPLGRTRPLALSPIQLPRIWLPAEEAG